MPSQLQDVQGGDGGDRKGQTEDAEVEDADEQIVHPDIEKNTGQADAQRNARLVDGRKSRADHLDAGIGNKAKGVPFEGQGGEGGVFGGEAPVLVNRGDHRLGQNEESDRGGKSKEKGLPDADQKPVVQGLFVVHSRVAGQMRKSDGGHGHSEKADGQLDQPESVI